MEVLIGVIVGLVIGAAAAWFAGKGKATALAEELQANRTELQTAQQDRTRLAEERARFEERAMQVERIENELRQTEQARNELRDEVEQLRIKGKELEERMISDKRLYEENVKLLDEAKEKLGDSFKSLASQALQSSNESFIQLAKEAFAKEQETAKGELSQRKQSIEELVKPLAEALGKYESNLKNLDEKHLQRDTETKERIEELLKGIAQQQNATQELKGLLRGPSARGRAGEMLLERIFEAAGLAKNIHYFAQQHEGGEGGGGRPDFIVKMPGDKEIVIDSKFVLSAYEAAMTAEDDRIRADKLREHAAHVKGHIDALAKRPYADRSKNIELVVMFLPLDACLTAAQEVDSEITTKGWDRRIVVATPSLLFAVMRMVELDWRQENLRANSDEIQKLGKEMVDRIRIAVEHFAGIGDGLDKAARAYNSAVGSIQSQLLTSAYRFQKLEAGKDVKLEAKKLPKTVEREPATFTKTELQSLPGMEVRDRLQDQLALGATFEELTDGTDGEPGEAVINLVETAE